MSGGRKPRTVANPLESATATPSERVLQECHGLYTDTDHGLVKIADGLGLRLLPPQKKIIVMIMGNHSAGKSSFINWYVEEHIQKTGVAIETQGFTFITSGRRRESLTGNATLHLYPHFRPPLEFKGVSDYLSAEISTSKQKKFNLVTFVDTPGLVDGDMIYPFDVNSAITWFGEQADLIFVFFDPMGQALCKRTLNIVEKLSEKCGDKLLFYLSKADEAGNETDRQRVMMQIVQELCRRPGLNKCGFEMPTIFIPNPQKPSRCVNQIDGVCQTIEKTINQAVQKTLNQLEKDCDLICSTISSKLAQDRYGYLLLVYFMACVRKMKLSLGPTRYKTLTKKEKRILAEFNEYVHEVVQTKKVGPLHIGSYIIFSVQKLQFYFSSSNSGSSMKTIYSSVQPNMIFNLRKSSACRVLCCVVGSLVGKKKFLSSDDLQQICMYVQYRQKFGHTFSLNVFSLFS
uniref:Dynamin N-terminal domain-containing protein n=1 Tax=Denticeps clupeoides TaxID=299321 RepID=A0AAY4BLS1_9TELE